MGRKRKGERTGLGREDRYEEHRYRESIRDGGTFVIRNPIRGRSSALKAIENG
jgi:hypothetical protein